MSFRRALPLLATVSIASLGARQAPGLATTYEAAVAAHQKRCLAEASEGYARVLAADPPRGLTTDERALVLSLAPSLRLHADEFFGLDNVAAILHPDRPLVGYHLFWDDDVDFPEDNDPTDHEVIWVEFDPATRRASRVVTYFHGALLEASGDRLAREEDGRPIVGVEWGKHGSLPSLANLAAQPPPALRRHWTTLNTTGTRRPTHPLAKGWPTRFAGSWESYCTFPRTLDTRPELTRADLLIAGRWANAIIDQHLLPYNFAAKTDWP
jgi:hypothetical protein